MSLDTEGVLREFGGGKKCNLIEILNLGNMVEDNDNDILISNSSDYYDIDHLKSFLDNNRKSFTILSLNARSILNKHSKIIALLTTLHESNLSFDMVCIQECWLDQKINSDLLHINNYKTFHQCPNPKCSTRGGLVCYVRDDLSCKVSLKCNKYSTWEGIFLEINFDKKSKLTIGNIYRPPHNENSIDFQTFLNDFTQVLDNISKSAANLVLVGDFNVDLLRVNSNSNYQKFHDIMTGLHLVPNITLPTRFPEKKSEINPSLIDQIYTKISGSLKQIKAGILQRPISDHLPTFIALKLSNTNHGTKPKYVTSQTNTPKARDSFITELSLINWPNLFDHDAKGDPQISYKIFQTKLKSLQDKHFPTRTVKFNKYKHKLAHWITNGILNSLKFRDKLYKKTQSTPRATQTHDTLKNNLKNYNNILNKLIREAKADYYSKQFTKHKTDSRKTWDTIKEVLNRPKSKPKLPSHFKHNDDSITDPIEIANKFNDFFVNIGPNLAAQIDIQNKPPFTSYLKSTISPTFHFDQINEAITTKIISNLKPKASCGFDNISLQLLKQCSTLIVKPLTAIINQSLTNGIFPDDLKVAKVIPIYKKEDEHQFDNYRPISLLPAISKILEKIAHKQLFAYLTQHKLLYNHQYGFREGHSTELAVLEFIDRIYGHLDNNKTPISVFIDLSKAFDTIDHNILCHKLHFYGILNTELKWFKSYLTNRKQYVDLSGSISNMENISTGVPQGSILGPLLFTIYMNDIANASNFHSILYADDTTLINPITYCPTHDNTNDTATQINLELDKICDWLAVNKLSLNAKKTKYMTFNWPQNKKAALFRPSLVIQGQQIEKVANFKFLGITLDTNLNWHSHVMELGNKLSRTNGVLSRLKNFIPASVLITIYNALFLSHLNYGITCWGFNNCSRITHLQKRAIRNVTKSKYNAHTEPLFKLLSTPKLEDIFKLSCLKIYYKYHNNSLPVFFSNLPFKNAQNTIQQIHTRPRRIRVPTERYRNSQAILPNLNPTISIVSTHKTLSRQCIRHYIPQLINDKYLPEQSIEKVHTHSQKSFNTYAKNIVIQRYSDTCNIRDCYICQRPSITT